MTTRYYFNNRNKHKQLMVVRYKCGHYAVLPFMAFGNGIINKLGDGCLHRWTKKNLDVLLEDYTEVR